MTSPLIELLLEEMAASNVPVENGIRDITLLESAVNAVFQTFGGEDLFPSISEKAARLCVGLTNNHAFIDGNKRIVAHTMELFLLLNGATLCCEDDEVEQLIMGIADDRYSYEDTLNWVNEHTK